MMKVMIAFDLPMNGAVRKMVGPYNTHILATFLHKQWRTAVLT